MTDDFKDEIRSRMNGPPSPVYQLQPGEYPIDKLQEVDPEQFEEGKTLIRIGEPMFDLSTVADSPVTYEETATGQYQLEPYVDVLAKTYTEDVDALRQRILDTEYPEAFVTVLTRERYGGQRQNQHLADVITYKVEKVQSIIDDFSTSGVYYPVWLVVNDEGDVAVADGNHRATALSVAYPDAELLTWVSRV